MRRVRKFKVDAENNIVLGDGTILQTKGDQGNKGDRGTDGVDGEDINGGSQFGPGLRGLIGLTGLSGRPGIDGEDGEDAWIIPGKNGIVGSQGLMGVPGRDGEDAEENDLSLRMGTHGSFADDDHPQYQKESEKDAASGYAGLSAASRITKGVDATDDVIVDLATKGLVLKDVADPAHYWRITVGTDGILATADLGHTKP